MEKTNVIDLSRFRLMGDSKSLNTQQDKNKNYSLFKQRIDKFYMDYIDFSKAAFVSDRGELHLSQEAQNHAVILLLDAKAFENYGGIRRTAIKEADVIIPAIGYIGRELS